jgi:hypothetical protein
MLDCAWPAAFCELLKLLWDGALAAQKLENVCAHVKHFPP